MITTKQRAILRGMATSIQPIIQVGKGGLNENLIKTVSDALEARELIKLTVLENSEETPASAAHALAEAVGADVVAVIGKKVVLYRESSTKKTIEI